MEILEILKHEHEVKLCSECKGRGLEFDDERDLIKCSNCNGTGRVITVIARCQVDIPFDEKRLLQIYNQY